MNPKLKIIIYIAVFVVVIVGSVFAYNALKDGTSSPPVAEGGQESTTENPKEIKQENTSEKRDEDKTKAPDFTVYDADGKPVKLSDMKGKPIVLNFWASWCPPCKSEMPHFNEVYLELGSEVQFLMVDLVDGQRETVDKGSAYIKDQGYGFPVYFDTEGEAGYSYAVRSIPTTYFIDKDGYIITGAQGAIDENSLRKSIDMIR